MVASIVAPYILYVNCAVAIFPTTCESSLPEHNLWSFSGRLCCSESDRWWRHNAAVWERDCYHIFTQFFLQLVLISSKIIFYFFYVYSDRVRNTLTAQERRSGDHFWVECAAARGDSAQLCEADLVASSCVAAETQEEVWRRMYDNEARWEPEQAARVCVTDSASLTWNL